MWILSASCNVFFGSIWKDTGDTQGLMSRILKDVAYCIGILLRDLVDSGSCRLFVVWFYGSWISQLVLLWDPLDLGSCIQVMLWDPRDLGSCLAVLPSDPVFWSRHLSDAHAVGTKRPEIQNSDSHFSSVTLCILLHLLSWENVSKALNPVGFTAFDKFSKTALM